MAESIKTVVTVIEDLFFTVKIADAAKRAGARALFVKTEDAAVASLSDNPSLIIVDLNCATIDPIALISRIKTSDRPDVPVIGFVSHVQVDLRQRAQEAGYNSVIARSAFSGNLPDILRRHTS